MPTRLAVPLITVDESKMHEIDTSNVENLFSMWTVFNRCADSLDQGRRLENLSWRLWNRETFCCEPRAQFANPPARLDRTPRQSRQQVPQLSSSVDSASSADDYEPAAAAATTADDACARQTPPSPVTIRALSSSTSIQSMSTSMRSKPKPISSRAWERMVISIKETKITQRDELPSLPASVTAAVRPAPQPRRQDPLLSLPSPPAPVAEPQQAYKPSLPRASHSSASTVPLSSPESSLAQSQTFGSETSAELISTPDIVRGFTASSISCHRISTPQSPGPAGSSPARSGPRDRAQLAASKAQFLLGLSDEESGSSLEEQASFKHRVSPPPASRATRPAAAAVKQASFSERVETRRFESAVSDDEDEGAIASDDDDDDEDDDDDVDESAIDEDDDEDDWDEVSEDEAEPEMPVAPVFKRIDSKANLSSRRSLITSALHQTDRASQVAAQASNLQPPMRRSRTTSPNGPSLAASMEEDEEPMQGIKITRPKPSLNTTNLHPPALSPRTTRRNMLATELTESLRKHLLWERQQKNVTANAVLKRRHTSQDVAHLRRLPGPGDSGAGSKTSSWNNYFEHGLSEYHTKGW